MDPVYPLAEATVGLASAFLVLFMGPTPATAAVLAILWTGVVAGWIDLTTQQIPEWATLALFWGGLLASPLEPDLQVRVQGAFLAFVLVGGVFALSGWVLKVDAMSGGDVALATAAAAWFGPMPALAMFILAAAAVLAYGIPMRRAGMDWTPYGPALASGAVGQVPVGLLARRPRVGRDLGIRCGAHNRASPFSTFWMSSVASCGVRSGVTASGGLNTRCSAVEMSP